MKRALWVLAGICVLTGLTWACWPGDDEGLAPGGTGPLAQAPQPPRSLAEQLDDVDRQLDASDAGRGRVSGIVEDEAGLPVEGAEVRAFQSGGHALAAASCPVCQQPILECPDVHTAHDVIEAVRAGRGQPRQLAVTTTGPDGTFHFEDLPQQQLALTARKGDQVGRGTHGPGDEAVLMLSPASRLSLRVVRRALDLEAPEVPLAGARVSAISLDSFRMLQTTSDGAGQLGLDGLDEGTGVWALIEAPGLLALTTTVFSDQDDTEVALQPARALLVRTAIGGKPVETKVTVTPASGQHPMQQQTQGGSARFEGLADEGCEVTASTESMVAPNQAVMLEQELTTLELELRPAARLLVTVVDEAGEPVLNAELTAAGRAGDFHSGTASDGAPVVLDHLSEGPISLEVSTFEFRPWHRNLELHPGDNPVEVVLKKGVKLSGRVVDAEGQPVLQALIEARTPIDAPAVTYSEADGSFELTFDEPGPQELTASLDAVGRTTVSLQAPAEGAVIRLEPRARLRVVVREGSAPVLGASVAVSRASGINDLNTVTDSDGVAVLSGLDTGRYEVMVQSPEFRQPPIAIVSVIEGRTVSLEIGLDRGLSISGRVVDGRGAPVAGAEVSTDPWTLNATSDEEGRFTLPTLDPDATYQVEATTELLHSAPVQLKGAQAALQLVLIPRPMASGKVVDGVTGAAVTRFDVDSQRIEAADGRFSVPVRAEGSRVLITISAEGFETVSWEGSLEASRDLGTVRLQKAKVIEGLVRDVRGNPVAGAMVTSDSSDEEVSSAADGSFRLRLSQYEPGSTLTAQRGQLKGAAPIQLGRLSEIILDPPTRVLGQVLDSAGRPGVGGVLLREAISNEELQVEAGRDGAFEIDVAPGRWVFSTGLNPAGQTFAVSGASMRVVLGAPPGSCAVAVISGSAPDELLLLPGEMTPAPSVSLDLLSTLEGAVLFDTFSGSRLQRAAGFRCGPYTLVARWGAVQRVQRVDLRSGGPNELQLADPPELSASAQPLAGGH